MNAVLLGATRGMGRALARAMAARGDSVFLLGRNPTELERSARDLELRGALGEVATAPCDLGDPASFGSALERAAATLDFDTVVVTAGQFETQEELEEDGARAAELLRVNFAHTIAFCEEARRRLLERGGGTLAVFSSVAGDRGRKPMVLYGAAKAGLSAYMEGLDHRYRARGLRAVLVKPGFVHTGMTAGLAAPPFAGEPEAVARRVLGAIDRGRPVVYAPAVWRWVMMAVRALPRAVMRRVEF